jgi:hypothetical protein
MIGEFAEQPNSVDVGNRTARVRVVNACKLSVKRTTRHVERRIGAV